MNTVDSIQNLEWNLEWISPIFGLYSERIVRIVNFQVQVPKNLPLELTPLNGFLNGFGKKRGNGRGTPEKYALDFQQFKMKKPNLSIGLFAEEERKTRLELATPTLARLCSTN